MKQKATEANNILFIGVVGLVRDKDRKNNDISVQFLV